MKNILAQMAVAALMFVHFKTPAGEKLYVPNEAITDDMRARGIVESKDGFARDASGAKLPVGVRVFGPGSREYRLAEDRVATENLRRGRNKLTGEQLRANATAIMARTTLEFVNFDYNGKTVSSNMSVDEREKVCEQLYNDLEYVAVRDQVETEQGDLGNYSQKATSA